MHIDPTHLLGRLRLEGVQGGEEVKISLFIVSKKVHQLKQIDIRNLNREQGRKKLRQWSQESRFVAVIEFGDQLYAHANRKMAKKLDEKGVTLADKKVVVKALSDEDYEHLAVVGQAFGEALLAHSANTEERESTNKVQAKSQNALQRYLAINHFLNGQIRIQGSIDHLMDKLSYQVISNILTRMAEARRELEAQQKQEEKARYIKTQEINRDNLKEDVKKEAIKKQNIQARIS